MYTVRIAARWNTILCVIKNARNVELFREN